MKGILKKFNLPDGREISIETGRLAKQADGAAVVRMGNTMMLATVVSATDVSDDVDFLPLTVDYREKYSAAGKFPGGFFKREARPSESEILICRLVDRALRPLFPKDYHASTVVQISLLSADKEVVPDTLACLAASAALAVSDIPFSGPISEVRVGRKDGQMMINPSIETLDELDIDMIIAATKDSVVMVEGEMQEVSEEEMVDAITLAHEAIKVQCQALLELKTEVNKEIREYCHEPSDEDLKKKIWEFCYDRCSEIARSKIADKKVRSDSFKAVKQDVVAELGEDFAADNAFLIGMYFHACEKEAVRQVMLKDKIRLDGRALDEVRPIWSEIDYLPSAHGSAIFTRGETQSLTSITLGTSKDEQTIDGAVLEGSLSFMLHYNFPPFSTGEARMPRGPGRREIGHGNLAQRALKPVIPSDTPYTVRVISDILESNGSSSMATVCAGSLALMDAGIKIKGGVSGIAMGLITDDSGKYSILSDILGDEDHLGDMDFKVAGTKNGITACQMDIKIQGLSKELLVEALHQARAGRLHILSEMEKTIAESRDDYKRFAPRIVHLTIPKDFIGAVIGPGGKVIQEMQAQTNTTIVVTEEGDKGLIEVFGSDLDGVESAISRIKAITKVPEEGEVYDAVVKNIMPYGMFVEFLPGKQGLVHISEISWKRLESLDGYYKEGDNVKVQLIGFEKGGKYKLSRKSLLKKPEAANN